MTQITAEQADLNKTTAETRKLNEEAAKLVAESNKLNAELTKHMSETALANKKVRWYEVTILLAIIATTATVAVAVTKAFL